MTDKPFDYEEYTRERLRQTTDKLEAAVAMQVNGLALMHYTANDLRLLSDALAYYLKDYRDVPDRDEAVVRNIFRLLDGASEALEELT